MRGRASRHSAPARCGCGATGATKSRTPPTRRRYAPAGIGPAIVVVNDDPDGLATMRGALADRYDRHYDVRGFGSRRRDRRARADGRRRGRVALVFVAMSLIADGRKQAAGPDPAPAPAHEADRGDPVGGQRQRRGRPHDSRCRRQRRLDHYVRAPRTRPTRTSITRSTGLLLDWTDTQRVSPQTVHIVGGSWDGRAYDLRNTLGALRHAPQLLARRLGNRSSRGAGGWDRRAPPRRVPERHDPARPDQRRDRGCDRLPRAPRWGLGPRHRRVRTVGLSAAVHGESEGLSTLVIDEGGVGGQATSSSLIRNYLGFPAGEAGAGSHERFSQAWVFGARFVFMQRATDVRCDPDTGDAERAARGRCLGVGARRAPRRPGRAGAGSVCPSWSSSRAPACTTADRPRRSRP